MAIYSNLIIDQGSAFSSTITVTDNDGNVVNLTSYTYAGKIKKSYDSSTAVSFATPTTPGTNGQIQITLTDTQSKAMEPGRYVYDVEITSSAYGCESEVFSASFTTTVDCTTPENISLTATPFNVTLS